MSQIKFFLDFDGTITTDDVVDRLLERFADSRWRVVEKDWVEGRIGSRECLTRQIDFVQATPEKLAALIREIHVDPLFVSFLIKAKELSVPVSIVSDGFDVIIHEILKRTLRDFPEILSGLSVYCNELKWDGTSFRACFPRANCAHDCANCKEALIRELAAPDDRIIFVGDGCSDRFAAGAANLTFAKEELLKFCEQHAIAHEPYSNFGDIEKWLETELPVVVHESPSPRRGEGRGEGDGNL